MWGNMNTPVPPNDHNHGAQDGTCISYPPRTCWSEATSLARWDLAPKKLSGGFEMELCLLSCPVGSGTLLWLFCHLFCTPRALGMLWPPWAELCCLVPAVILWRQISLPVWGS